MKRLHITFDIAGWAHHRRALALQRYAPATWEVTIADQTENAPPCDVLFYLPYGSLKRIRPHLDRLTKRPRVVSGYNVGYGYRREHLDDCLRYSDYVVINNRENWERLGRIDNTICIPNGVDCKTFYPESPIDKRPSRALSIGSKYHYDCNADLKGYDLLQSIRPRLESVGIECDFLMVDSIHSPMSADEMRAWYNSGGVYVVASLHEGTPNPALEAAACGCTVVSTLVGNMPELIQHGVNGLLVERRDDAIAVGIEEAITRRGQWGPAMLDSIQSWDWGVRAGQYFDLFDRLIREGG